MKKLKLLLHSNYFYIGLIILLCLYLFYYFNKNHNIELDLNNNSFIGYITNYKIDNDLLTLEVKGSQKIISYYYFKSDIEINYFTNNYNLGDKVYLEGEFTIPNNNTVPNLFNYKKYLKYKNIYTVMNISSMKKIKSNSNLFYKIKNTFIKHISKYKSKAYLNAFVLGNKNMIDNENTLSYQENGISHLLAVSGMHVSFLGMFIISILKKIKLKEEKVLIITSMFLIFYMFLTGLSASVSRSVLLFILLNINKLLKTNISTIKIFIITFIIILFFKPYFLFDIGFIYSFTISFYLILFKDKLNNNTYFKNLFLISFISFLVSLPITLYYSYQINFLSILLNMFYVPFVSIIVFPMSLITFIFSPLDNLFYMITNILESISLYTAKFTSFTFIMGKVNILFIISYYLLITLFLIFERKKYFFLILLILFIQYNSNFLFPKTYLIMIDVKQGDSILLHTNNKTVLLDTGGIVTFNNKKKSLTEKTLIPLLKSLGIRKIDYLVLSHGDYDHMGEAINLVNNIKVEKVIFNCGEFNNLEKELISVLDKKNIKHYSCIKELNINKNKLSFLQTREYDNENDNSNVIYTELNNYKFLFMGDASNTTEKEILNNYNLPNIDVLKVGHHGSKTSSSKDFIDVIKPNYSIISVGKNNRYGHPNKEALDNLKNSKIYRTDLNGSIMFKIKNNKLNIETYAP